MPPSATVLAALLLPSRAEHLSVDPSGGGTHRTIQEALDHIKAAERCGSTIILAAKSHTLDRTIFADGQT
eukprot:gene9577-8557_t